MSTNKTNGNRFVKKTLVSVFSLLVFTPFTFIWRLILFPFKMLNSLRNRLAGDSTTDAPLPTNEKKKLKGK